MKIKDLEPGVLVAIGTRTLKKAGDLSQALVVGPRFKLKYYEGLTTVEADPKRVMIIMPLKDGIGYPSVVFSILQENEDIEVRLSRILEIRKRLEGLNFLVTSINPQQIHMPWERWVKEKGEIKKARSQEIKKEIKTSAQNEERYDKIQERLLSLDIDLDEPARHSKRFMLCFSLDQAEKVVEIIESFKRRAN